MNAWAEVTLGTEENRWIRKPCHEGLLHPVSICGEKHLWWIHRGGTSGCKVKCFLWKPPEGSSHLVCSATRAIKRLSQGISCKVNYPSSSSTVTMDIAIPRPAWRVGDTFPKGVWINMWEILHSCSQPASYLIPLLLLFPLCFLLLLLLYLFKMFFLIIFLHSI